MNLKQLEAFVEVAQSGSFSKAAKKLFLTQPTISAHIASLEKELDTRVFVRNTKEVDLSPEGKKLYTYARQILDLTEKIKEEFGRHEEEAKCVTIAASTIPAQYLLPDILTRFNEKHPGEQLRILESDSAQVAEQVAEGSVDIGFTGTVLEKKFCKYIPFYKDQLVVITPNTEKYQEYKRMGGDISWIQEESVIMREEGSGTRKEAEKQLRHLGIRTERLRIIASIANQETIKKSVTQGMGISILSRLAAKNEVESGRVLEFPIPEADEGRDLNLVYNKNHPLTRSAQRFIKTVKEIYDIK
ncbi:selenium metabolism-associated LysR family transcriptional regulator [Lachnoclostridium sp. An118]|uniref:selenium metabolism-associated LysR family transcriptional regulator n=1 Tax=Lachnoclostridium sp. An118 TaxID=1965547 RepID=UPI000B38F186|nr:selenium metabolism-associated LysR family transcriptional regulator [Lachnoclostridium sp. An118]OUQ50093.1 LysR family transcriptional regulator [Lachnoclostridium sp. An118]